MKVVIEVAIIDRIGKNRRAHILDIEMKTKKKYYM